MTMWGSDGSIISKDQNDIIEKIRTLIFKENKIVAVKGIGGFLLLVNACDDQVIMELRKRKERLEKPFAVMYPNLEILQRDVSLNSLELNALSSPESPIVLVPLKESPNSGIKKGLVAPNLNQLGVMLPYTGLYELILHGMEVPIIATSANVSNSPIVFDNAEALSTLRDIADVIVTNDREIYVPQDDSVVKFSPIKNQRIVLRRSRGLAPSFIDDSFDTDAQRCILSMGADMKSSFSIQTNGAIYTSQYLGDLSHFSCEESYQLCLDHLLKVTGAKPDVILTDSHPNYISTHIGQDISDAYNLPIQSIQHHKAHFAAVLGENRLLEEQEGVLGVVWDGTGYGEDGHVWGGEFFHYSHCNMRRIGHMDYFHHISADRMSKEPRLSLLSLLAHRAEELPFIRTKFSTREWAIYSDLIKRNHIIQSSSMGRIFDAVSSMLGLADYNEYEGHAALLLEQNAQAYVSLHGVPEPFPCVLDEGPSFSGGLLLENILNELYKGKPVEELAARFHVSLVEIVRKVAQSYNLDKIAFTGGVFQNTLLTDLIIVGLEKDFSLYFHKELSPNDENISYGQLAYQHILTRHYEIYALQQDINSTLINS
jgi:hydrogenase maturation protein HypF